MKKRILLVEDDKTFSTILAGYLEAKDLSVDTVETGKEMLQIVTTQLYDAILLDLGLPDDDGLILLRRLSNRLAIPIMVITGRSSIETRLTAFELGASDILIKPFHPKELQYRVINLLNKKIDSQVKLRALEWEVDLAQRTVVSTQTQATLPLTRAEFDAFVFLLKGRGQVFTRAQIIDATISSDSNPESERSIDILISRIRKKLSKNQNAPALIETVRGVGYRINPTIVHSTEH
ncbi:MAG TPA: response regulator transcription factor [Candidatus Sphingobacterium stercoripullorum]|nr:response regulator transcription factor [Candidatus Sphingobacterium stercoripullorum]